MESKSKTLGNRIDEYRKKTIKTSENPFTNVIDGMSQAQVIIMTEINSLLYADELNMKLIMI